VPRAPLTLEPVDVPGALVYVDPANEKAITRSSSDANDGQVAAFHLLRFEGRRAVLEDTFEVEANWSVSSTTAYRNP
jgi:hypothetical protein